MEATVQEPTTVGALRQAAPGAGAMAMAQATAPGYGSLAAFELLHRQAKALSASNLVPTMYQQVIYKLDREGNVVSQRENPNAIPNTMIALNMATRMNADPVMVMQNLYVVEGRPSWSSQWVIAQINNCGRFEPLRFDLVEKGMQQASWEVTEWKDNPNGGKRIPNKVTKTVDIENVECTAWTVPKGVKIPVGVVTLADARKAGLPILKGPKVSVAMAVAEGWYGKNGSKWQTMPELMLHYRSGAFFGRLYAPELLMGFPTQDEVQDMGTLVAGNDGTFAPDPEAANNPSVNSLRKPPQERAHVEDVTARSAASASDGQGEGQFTATTQTPAAEQQQQQQPKASTQTPIQQATAAAAAEGTLFGNTD